jgi:membrane-associated protease RseP (regulator of RpoE activity)
MVAGTPGKPDATPDVQADRTRFLEFVSDYRIAVQGEAEVVRARLLPGVSAADPRVRAALAPWGTAYVQVDPWGTEVVLTRPLETAPPARWRVHFWLFLLTLLTTLAAGAMLQGVDPFDTDYIGGWLPLPTWIDGRALWVGAPFALPFLAILLCHETGHYLAARRHRIPVTPPYFLPMPPWLSLVGTMGAFIRIKGPTVRRSVLFDVGAAGPYASFVLSIPVLLIGLALSESASGRTDLATPFFVRFAGETVWLGNSALLQLLGPFFFPAFGSEPVLLHPLAFAGWLGLFVTALNLMPLGQLDGGHILYSLWDHAGQERAARLFVLLLLPLGLLWWGWWVWGGAALLVNRGRLRHPPVLQPAVPLDARRSALARSAIAMFFLTLPPLPIAL